MDWSNEQLLNFTFESRISLNFGPATASIIDRTKTILWCMDGYG